MRSDTTIRSTGLFETFAGLALSSFMGAVTIGSVLSGSAWASTLDVSFREGAPTDRFTITNATACTVRDSTLLIDLNSSRGALVLDVAEKGDGVGVFQPLRVVEGEDALAAAPSAKDGDRSITLRIARLAPGETIAFTVDLDDTRKAREITVADDELTGATVTLQTGGSSDVVRFRDGASVRLILSNCSE